MGLAGFRKNVNPQNYTRCQGPSRQGCCVMKVLWIRKHFGFWMASALCGMNLISSRTPWKSWSWWWEARCYRRPAYKTASCSRVSHWLPPAQVWALHQQTNPRALEGARSHHRKVGRLQSDFTGCIYRNQALVSKFRARHIFIVLFYFYNNSYEFELARDIVVLTF